MAGAILNRHDHVHDEWEWGAPTGEEFATRVFTLAIAGIFAVIALMVVMGGGV